MDPGFDLSEEPAPEAAAPPAYLDGLNPEQRQAVETAEGPVLVLAGAGTGKTRVLTARLAHILRTRRAAPGEILAVTFTNKAAREMRERTMRFIGAPVEGWWIGTFHALGARMLRHNADAAGLRSNFTILDTDDQLRLVKQLLAEHNIDVKHAPPRVTLAQIQRWKDRGLPPGKVPEAELSEACAGRGKEIYTAYQDRLQAVNAADFGDLLLLTVNMLQKHREVLERYQSRFKYILVDEYQDTNVAQYLWLRLLAQRHKNICCVGDDDQSIYSWRGAEVGNILRFETDFPGAAVVRLERNYRSTPNILGAASGLIDKNGDRLGKTLWTEADAGEPVRVCGVWDGEEEARFIGDEIEALHAKKHPLAEIAILVRAGFQTREFEERLMTLAIPYRVVGGPRFYERQEIRDALAYIRVVLQPDDDLAFERIINTPKRGLGPAALQPIHVLSRNERISLTAAAEKLLTTDELRPAAQKALGGLMENFRRWRELLEVMHHPDLVKMILEDSGYIQMWRENKQPDAPGRVDNLKELVSGLEEYGGLAEFTEHVSLVMENDALNDPDKVSIMTLHSAKGLEFDTVFLPGWEEGVFPNQRSLDENGAPALEEERRLAYVGLTRARLRAVVIYAANRRVYNQWQSALPSRFIDEIPDEHAERSAAAGLGGAESRTYGLQSAARVGFAPGPRMKRQADALSARGPGGGAGGLRERQSHARAKTLKVGQRVFHQKFGYGAVSAIDGEKLEIAFEKAGDKKVMAGFVEAA
ncbi:MAG: ATP-dependent helicase [Rhodospirillales bacterium]